MKNQSNVAVSKTNRFAVISLLAGALSILPYLPLLIHFLLLALNALEFEQSKIYENIPMVVYGLGGMLFGPIGLVASNKALKQIETSGDFKKGRRIAKIGKVLSIFGIVANIGVFVVMWISALFIRG